MKVVFAFITTGNDQNLQTYYHCHENADILSILFLLLLLEDFPSYAFFRVRSRKVKWLNGGP